VQGLAQRRAQGDRARRRPRQRRRPRPPRGGRVRPLVALDLDGTIEDSRDDMVAAVQRVRARFGLAARPDEEFRPHVNAGMDHLYRSCFADLLQRGGLLGEITGAYEADYLAHIADATRLYDGMAEVLAELAGRAAL